jgi:hypothetical protein
MASLQYHPPVPRPRKRPEGVRPTRFTFEVYDAETETLLRRARAAAALRGEPFREWLFRAMRERLAQEEQEEGTPPA